MEGFRRTWNSWKTPKLDAEDEAKWSVEMMGKSPLNRLAALDLAEEGRSSPVPRAETPGELDYAHLGSFKLGSLRVTNGPASPTPSAKFRRRRYVIFEARRMRQLALVNATEIGTPQDIFTNFYAQPQVESKSVFRRRLLHVYRALRQSSHHEDD
jgi:hypothetical protein